MPSPDVVLCARIGHTKVSDLRKSVEGFRELDLRVHGMVLWDDDLPQFDARDEVTDLMQRREAKTSVLIGT